MTEENQKEKDKQAEIDEPVEPKRKDIISEFRYWCEFISSDPIKRYDAKCKSVEKGKELLPFDLEDPDKQKIIETIHKKACATLKTAIPGQRNTAYDYMDEGGKRHLCMKISSDDAGESTTPETEYKKTLEDFIVQQYQQHMGELQEVFDEIYHQLVIHKIIKKEDKSSDELMEDFIKTKFKTKFGIKKENKKQEVKKDAK